MNHIETGTKKKKHLHHCIPKHAGGTNDPSNLVELTVEEHAEAHRLLYEKYGRWQDKLAWKSLIGCIGKEEIQSEAARQSIMSRERNSEEWKKGWETRRKNGWKPLEETKKKQSEALKGLKRKPFSDEHRAKIAENTKRQHIEGNIGKYPNHASTKWWNNGVINKRSKECPGPNFKLGKLIKK